MISWFILIAALFIAAPMGLWLAGIGPALMLIVNISAFILTVRLFSFVAALSPIRWHVIMMGLFSGLIGSLLGEILLHMGGAANLATAFAAYAGLGPKLYRLDVLSFWWPYVFVGLSGVFYAGLATLVSHLVLYRRQLLGLEPLLPITNK